MFDESNFKEYLRQHKPYLYDIEMQVDKLKESGGYGEISVAISMSNEIVDRGEILMSIKRIYVQKKNNRYIDTQPKTR